MYQGWFCFGGTEIINNERARGYAETASQLPDFRTIVDEGRGEEYVTENLFPNPSFRATSGTVEVHRNLWRTPAMSNLGMVIAQGATLAVVPGGVEVTRTASPGRASTNAGQRVAITPGTYTVTARRQVDAPVDNTGLVAGRLVVVGYDSAGTHRSNAYLLYLGTAPTVGVETISETITPPEWVTTLELSWYSGGTNGDKIIWRDVGVITGAGPYFDGSHQPKAADYTPGDPIPQGYALSADGSYLYDADFEVSWTGAENASASVLTGEAVAGVTADYCLAIQSTRFAEPGRFSMRLIPTGSEVGGVLALLPTASSVTGVGTVSLDAPLQGTLDDALTLMMWSSDGPITVTAPNLAGDHPLRLMGGEPIGGGVLIVLTGATLGNGDVWWSDVGLFTGDYDGPWFDGTFAPEGHRSLWQGDPDESASTLIQLAIPPEYARYCDIHWFKEERCEHLHEALSVPMGAHHASDDPSLPYEAQHIPEDAPWFSPKIGFVAGEVGGNFLGAYAISVRGLSDTIRDIRTTQGITDGGIIGRSRRAVPQFRFRVLLLGLTEAGLEHGNTWLARTLDESTCSTHGPSCGSVDLTFFSECPQPTRFEGGPRWYRLESTQRFYHDVKCIDGPIIVEEIRLPQRNIFARIVEFTLEAGNPHLYSSDPDYKWISPSGSTIVNDIPRNEVPFPSAEIASTDEVIVATNYCTNPSVEVDAAGWSGVQSVIPGGQIASGRVTGELAVAGVASYRRVFTATAGGTNGWFGIQSETEFPASNSLSITMWAAAVVVTGSPALTGITFEVVWLDISSTPLWTDVLGSAPAAGGSITAKALQPPAGARRARVRAKLNVASWANGNVIRLYADAVGVMKP